MIALFSMFKIKATDKQGCLIAVCNTLIFDCPTLLDKVLQEWEDTDFEMVFSDPKIKEILDKMKCSKQQFEVNPKSQRKTKNLGFNTVKTRDESYAEIERKCPTTRCSDGKHTGERILPVRKFYLNKGGEGVQGACIVCQTNRRANRTACCREKFQGKTNQEVYDMYLRDYGQTKTCSKCKTQRPPSEFHISIGMESGLHNQCILCSVGNSQGNGDVRDFIFMPDKDGVKYKKKEKCERCEGTDKLSVDHILPIAKGGTDCIPNKQTLCMNCNSKKNDTIDCMVSSDLLSSRYKDPSLDFTDNMNLSHVLSKKVFEFKQTHIVNASLEAVRSSIKDYAKIHNLGHDLDRIIRKIADIFKKF